MKREIGWIKNGWRLLLSRREIRRGKRKGLFEVTYRKGSRVKRAFLFGNEIKKGGDKL